MVHARRVGDRDLTFLVSGKLWRNSLIMQDEETGTLWSHITGEALDGELAGERLAIIPGVQTTWEAWREVHPDTRLLVKDAEVGSSRYESYFDDPERTGLFRANWLQERLPGKELVYGIRRGPHAVAVTAGALTGGDPVTVPLGGESVTVRLDADGGVRAQDAAERPLDVLTVFWFAWSSFYPNTGVVD